MTAAYVFLRDVEHKFQMVHDLQTHSLPAEEDELERCAIGMGHALEDRRTACNRFVPDYANYTATVHHRFDSFFSQSESSPGFQHAL